MEKNSALVPEILLFKTGPLIRWGIEMNIKTFVEEEKLQLKKLEELVKASIKEEQFLSTRLLEIETDAEITFGQKIADKVAEFGGSWSFIIVFFSTMILWIVANVAALNTQPFDPYPFILLNLVLSCLAALQAPIIMMSQNRQEDKDRKRARGDYLINMKAEMEVRSLHGKIDLLLTEQMRSLFKVQEAQLTLLERIDHSLKKLTPDKKHSP